jgi:hypothetical protein
LIDPGTRAVEIRPRSYASFAGLFLWVTHAPDRGLLVLWRLRSALALWTAFRRASLSIAAQELNAFLMPLAVGFPAALAATARRSPAASAEGGCASSSVSACLRRIRGLQALV